MAASEMAASVARTRQRRPHRQRRLGRLAPAAAAFGTLCLAVAAADPAGAASTVTASTVTASTVVAGTAAAGAAAAQPAVTAPGGPGSPSFFDLARKDCLGTARNTGSKV
jgi:hypothetical protein